MISTSPHTHALPALVAEEQEVLDRVLPALRALQTQEGERERELVTRTKELHREWTNARGDVSQRAAFEEALEHDDPNAHFGGFGGMAKAGAYQDLAIRERADKITFDFTFRQIAAGGRSLMSKLPTRLVGGKTVFDLEIGRPSNTELAQPRVSLAALTPSELIQVG